jgi:hypothetical protein
VPDGPGLGYEPEEISCSHIAWIECSMADRRQVSAVGVPQQLDEFAAPPPGAIGASKFAASQTALRLSQPASFDSITRAKSSSS